MKLNILSLLFLSIALPALSDTAMFTFTCTVVPYIAVKVNDSYQIALNDSNFAVLPVIEAECSGECNIVSEKEKGIYIYSVTMGE